MALIMSRLALGLFALAMLTGCSPKLRLEIFNNTEETMTVSYWKDEITIAPMSVESMSIRLGNQRLVVKTGSIDGAYSIGFSSFPGECYGPGLQHVVKIRIDNTGMLFVLSNEQEFSADEARCGQYRVSA